MYAFEAECKITVETKQVRRSTVLGTLVFLAHHSLPFASRQSYETKIKINAKMAMKQRTLMGGVHYDRKSRILYTKKEPNDEQIR